MRIRPLRPVPWDEVDGLIAESEAEGFRFLRRFHDEYLGGRTRFDRPGEVLLGAWDGPRLIALGGVTRDPYVGRDDASSRVGRLRHVYVARGERGRGVGRALVRALEARARRHFDLLRLRTDTDAAAAFYERLGYLRRPRGGTATHVLRLAADRG